MQTDTRRPTDSDHLILIRTACQIIRDLELHIMSRFPEYTEDIESLVDIYRETVIPLAQTDHNRAISCIVRTNNYLNTQVQTCKLTGCPNEREHDYYRAVIELVFHARDKIIDRCLSEGIIPGVSTN